MSNRNTMPPICNFKNCQSGGELYKLFCKIRSAGLICAFCKWAWIVCGDVLIIIDDKNRGIVYKNREHDSKYKRVVYKNRTYSLNYCQVDLKNRLKTQVYKNIADKYRQVVC